jgi:hypothetical protein
LDFLINYYARFCFRKGFRSRIKSTRARKFFMQFLFKKQPVYAFEYHKTVSCTTPAGENVPWGLWPPTDPYGPGRPFYSKMKKIAILVIFIYNSVKNLNFFLKIRNISGYYKLYAIKKYKVEKNYLSEAV